MIILFLGMTVFSGCLEAILVPDEEFAPKPEPAMIFGVPPPFSQSENGLSRSPTFQSGKEPDPEKAKKGGALFAVWCRGCHEIKTKDNRIGPSLKDLFKRENLPASSKRVTGQNIRVQIRAPFRYMPPFPNLSEEEIEQIIEFLKTV
ncbi:MAG: c-type cytochrome [Candidatus Schekmanbacteria bacterium]|nr:c-type cytochrome [Candidatus Schekmanbacteria bacterium]